MSKFKNIIICLIMILTVSTVKAYTTTEEIDNLEVGVYIPNDTKLNASSYFSNNKGITINNIIINYIPSEEDNQNNKRDKNGDLINPRIDTIKSLDSVYIKKYKEIFETDLEFDGWIVTQFFCQNESLNIYLEPVLTKDLKAKEINWYSFREIELDKYDVSKGIETENINSSVLFHLLDNSNITYEFKSKKKEVLFFKIRGNLVGEGYIRDELEVYVDDEKQDVNITNMYQVYRINLKKGKHTLKIIYRRKSNGNKYIYLRDLGLIKDVDYHEDSYNEKKLKKYSSLLKEEIYNKSHTLYSVENYKEKKKNNVFIIVFIILFIVVIAYTIFRIGRKKHEKEN